MTEALQITAPQWVWLMVALTILVAGVIIGLLGLSVRRGAGAIEADLRERALRLAMENYPHLRTDDEALVKHARVLERYLVL